MQLGAGQNKQTVEHTNLLLRHQGELNTSAYLLGQMVYPCTWTCWNLTTRLKDQSDNAVALFCIPNEHLTFHKELYFSIFNTNNDFKIQYNWTSNEFRKTNSKQFH